MRHGRRSQSVGHPKAVGGLPMRLATKKGVYIHDLRSQWPVAVVPTARRDSLYDVRAFPVVTFPGAKKN